LALNFQTRGIADTIVQGEISFKQTTVSRRPIRESDVGNGRRGGRGIEHKPQETLYSKGGDRKILSGKEKKILSIGNLGVVVTIYEVLRCNKTVFPENSLPARKHRKENRTYKEKIETYPGRKKGPKRCRELTAGERSSFPKEVAKRVDSSAGQRGLEGSEKKGETVVLNRLCTEERKKGRRPVIQKTDRRRAKKKSSRCAERRPGRRLERLSRSEGRG